MPQDEVIKKESSSATKNAIYIVRFKKGTGAVKELNFLAESDEQAKEKALKFCSKHSYHHIYTKPFLTDLESEGTL